MSIQLSAHSLLQMLSHSGLLSDSQMRTVEQHFPASACDVSSAAICDWLLQRELITEWQAEKLLQARFRGFFLGPYKLLNRIARGGMSTIYSARHRESGEIHALKVLPLQRTSQGSYLSRFQREAEITKRMQHPCIVRVFGFYTDSDGQDPVHFMAMERLEGRDLFEIVNTDGPLPWRDAAEYICMAATGLAYAHSEGIIHRDIKPSNLFSTTDHSIRILDLGLAQDFDSEENLTREFNERVVGTADYLAPEQAAESHNVDGRADVYSLGCTFYFLLTGQPPFAEGTLVQRLVAHQTKIPPPVSLFRDDVPAELISILGDMMAKDRNQRIMSALNVTERLREYLAETAGPLRPKNCQQELADLDISMFSSCDKSFPGMLLESATETTTASDCPSDRRILPFDPISGEPLCDVFSTVPASASFSELLISIESQCDPAGDFSSDPRRAELLEVVRRLQERRKTDRRTLAINAARHLDNESSDSETPSETHCVRWILALCFLLIVIAVFAANIALR